MNKSRILIICIILTITLVLTTLFVLIKENNKSNENLENELQSNNVENNKFQELKDESSYFIVKECIEKYAKKVKQKELTSILEILDRKYVEEKNITEQNIFNNIDNISENQDVKIKKVLILNENSQRYYVFGELRSKGDEGKNRNNIYLTIDINLDDMTFAITPNVPSKEVFDE